MKFSIITPTYNRADLIERAIKSMLVQTHSNFEMIIIDDSSNDDTTAVVSNFLHDSRIKLIRCEINGGVNIARNIGLECISEDSEAVTFLDSDDEFEIDALENMKIVMDPHPDINYFRFAVRHESGISASDLRHSNIKADFNYYIKNLFDIGEWVCTFRRNIIERGFAYSVDVKAFEIISYIDLSRKETVFFSKKFVRKYYTGHESISNEKLSNEKLSNTIKGYEIMLSENKDIKSISPKIFAILNYTLANLYILDNNKIKGLNLTLKSFIISPIDLRVFRNLFNIILK